MMKGPLSLRLEYAVLETLSNYGEDGYVQRSWHSWMEEVSARGIPPGEFQRHDLLAAFKRLRRKNALQLIKPDGQYQRAFEYSGDELDDDKFFFAGRFGTTLTDQGRLYWNLIRDAGEEAPSRKGTGNRE